jgi:hypothetical protein
MIMFYICMLSVFFCCLCLLLFSLSSCFLCFLYLLITTELDRYLRVVVSSWNLFGHLPSPGTLSLFSSSIPFSSLLFSFYSLSFIFTFNKQRIGSAIMGRREMDQTRKVPAQWREADRVFSQRTLSCYLLPPVPGKRRPQGSQGRE